MRMRKNEKNVRVFTKKGIESLGNAETICAAKKFKGAKNIACG